MARARLALALAPARARLSRAAVVSVAIHGGLALLLIAWATLWPRLGPAEPEQQAAIEIMIGDNASRTGTPPAASDPAASAAGEPTAPAPPAVPAPQPPPPAAEAGAPAPAAQPRTQPAPSVPQPTPPPPAAAVAAAPPSVRVGDGVAISAAEIEDAGIIHPARSDVANVPPDYPLEAARRREQGTVVLRIFIAADGTVARVDVIQSSGFQLLDRAARDRIATWHFEPARRDGKPVPDVEEQAIRFLPD